MQEVQWRPGSAANLSVFSDQRIAQDVEKLCKKFSGILAQLPISRLCFQGSEDHAGCREAVQEVQRHPGSAAHLSSLFSGIRGSRRMSRSCARSSAASWLSCSSLRSPLSTTCIRRGACKFSSLPTRQLTARGFSHSCRVL